MGILAQLRARVLAILGGTYPADPLVTGDRRLPPGTFTPGVYRLPNQNPRFPAVSFERHFDTWWQSEAFESPDPGAENQQEGPHLAAVEWRLTIAYAIALPSGMTPKGSELAMGALDAASAKALEDWKAIEWCLLLVRNWDGLTPKVKNIQRTAKATTHKVDDLRLELRAPLVAWIEVPITTTPGLGT